MTTDAGDDSSPVSTVFVSYSREDLKAVQPIISAIEAAGYSAWWDGMLSAGERFANTTEVVLEQARAVVVLWSAKSVASHWVHDEATRGRDRGCLVPLSIDGTKPPLGFRQFQTYRVPPRRSASDPGIAAMLQAIATLHDGPASNPGTAFLVPQISRRSTIIGGGLGLAGAAAGGAWWAGLIGGGPHGNSVAVLPFANLGGDLQGNYFSAGLSAEVRSQLASETLLAVAAQTSSAKAAKTQQDAGAIAKALNVAYLLEGTVRREASRVRISAELIDGSSGLSHWAQTFDRELSNVFAVQEEIAASVVTALTQQMAAHGAKGTNKEIGGTNSFAAYDAYLRGRDLFDSASDQASDQLALDSFDKAIGADSNYAIAHAARARSLTVFGDQYDQGPTRLARFAEAIAAAQQAVKLAPNLAEAQASLGFALLDGRLDARGARQPYRLSYELGLGNADILSRFANFEARCGRFDTARPAVKRAAKLDPLNARTFHLIGQVEYCARNWAGVAPPNEKSLQLNPEMSNAHGAIALARLMEGDIAAALAGFVREKSSLFSLPGLAIVAFRQGKFAEAEQHLVELLASHGDNSLYQQAQIMAQWGRRDKALALLEAGYKAIDAGLVQLQNDPLVDPLRIEPRFIRLLDLIGFALSNQPESG